MKMQMMKMEIIRMRQNKMSESTALRDVRNLVLSKLLDLGIIMGDNCNYDDVLDALGRVQFVPNLRQMEIFHLYPDLAETAWREGWDLVRIYGGDVVVQRIDQANLVTDEEAIVLARGHGLILDPFGVVQGRRRNWWKKLQSAISGG